MGWNNGLAYRLVVEERLINQEMPSFHFHDKTNPAVTTVRGDFYSGSNTQYMLIVWLKGVFPDQMPGLYITWPNPLYDYYGNLVTSHGTNHSFHTWATDWETYVKICHCKAEFWSASNTIVSVIMKGMLWVEAYEVHKRTGRDLDSLSLGF